MVVDDDETNLLLASEVLGLFGAQPIAWSDAAAAFRAFQQDPVDLIFLDVHMPGMGGLELADKIRALEQQTGRQRTPIVALTASAMPHERQACLQHGMDEVMIKPFAFAELKATLRRWGQPEQ
ncbi:MAG TPA: response regulator [Ideonella sp.]|uniref:response regulator n=1 Tax=Ideonella sp. TaxID=1929293 RepID=UPI002E2F017D|nr:response regulator [Ideonella sp.]HEX5688184.1 response regulator [Ideonella sp.]